MRDRRRAARRWDDDASRLDALLAGMAIGLGYGVILSALFYWWVWR